ncbi:MAG: four helix bundle protein [Gemmatimonadota bacterium]|nr:four helix bundle protein [Gemmatimonadota bacterium]HEU4990152.1 four helix bundle protein [Gemmatimonadaceae bacterium]
MQNPDNLAVTREAITLASMTYRFAAHLPATERFELSAQMRRAAVSVGSNIVEGCGRNGNRALVASLHLALGSACELRFQAALAAELGLGDPGERAAVIEQAERVGRMLSRLIVALRKRPDRPNSL